MVRSDKEGEVNIVFMIVILHKIPIFRIFLDISNMKIYRMKFQLGGVPSRSKRGEME